MTTLRSSVTGSGGAGYTLVELLVVLTVIGLLLLAAPTIVSAAFPGVRAKSAAQQFADDLRAARMNAVLNGAETRVVVDAAGAQYAIQPGGPLRSLPSDVTIVAEQQARAAEAIVVRFYPDGSSSGGSYRVASGEHAHIVIDHPLTGRVAVDE